MADTQVVVQEASEITAIPQHIASALSRIVANAEKLNPNFNDELKQSFVTHLQLAFMNEPKLTQCTVESVSKAITSCIMYGFMPTRDAHFVPFGKDCTLMPEAKGLGLAIKRHPDIVDFATGVVYEQDEFDQGAMFSEPYHRPSRNPRPGKFQGAYCIVLLKEGHKKCEFVSAERLDQIRKMARSGDSPAWKNSFMEQCRAKAIQAWCRRYGHEYLSPSLIAPLEDEREVVPEITAESFDDSVELLFGERPKAQIPEWTEPSAQEEPEVVNEVETSPDAPQEAAEEVVAEPVAVPQEEIDKALAEVYRLKEHYKFENRRLTMACEVYGGKTPEELSYDNLIKLIRSMNQAGENG